MATRKFTINNGQDQDDVVEGVGSATTGNVQITIDLAIGMSRDEVLIAIDKIKDQINEGIWPPA